MWRSHTTWRCTTATGCIRHNHSPPLAHHSRTRVGVASAAAASTAATSAAAAVAAAAVAALEAHAAHTAAAEAAAAANQGAGACGACVSGGRGWFQPRRGWGQRARWRRGARERRHNHPPPLAHPVGGSQRRRRQRRRGDRRRGQLQLAQLTMPYGRELHSATGLRHRKYVTRCRGAECT